MKAFSLTQAAILLVAVLCFTATLEAKATPPAEIRLDAILTAFELYGQSPNFTVNPLPGIPIAANIAAAAVNGNPLILPETFFNISVTETFMLPPVTFNLALGAVARGSYAIVGPIFQGDVFTVASASAILSIPFIAPIESDPALTNALFPYASRMIPNSNDQAQVFIDLINHFYKLTYQRAWRQIGIISTTIAYSTGMTSALTTLAAQNDIAVIAYQQFLSASQDVLLAEDSITQEIDQLQKSDARVIVAVMLPIDFQLVMKRGQPLGLFEPNRIWFCSDGCAKMDVYMDLEEFPSRGVINDLKHSTYGLIGVQLPRPSGPQWIQFNATFYFIMGLQGLNYTLDEKYSPRVYDSVTAMALAADRLIKRGLPLNVTNVVGALRNTTFDGLSGKVAFDAAGNRVPSYDIVNAWRGLNCPSCFGLENPEDIFVPIGSWNTTEGLDFNLKSHFFDGRTIIPDLDIRKPYDYWSCHDKKKKTDETGKSVHLETPDGDDIDNIDIDYYCDNFIDCQNMSDESYDCDPSYVIMFIVVGIITGILVLIDVLLFLPFTIIFGFIVTRRRVRAASPVFLVIIVLSGVVGYCSTYAWYGKPHKVGCGWQPWLLGLSVVAMNAALFAKTFRIWRVFKSPFKVKVISNVELLILWAIQVAPAIFILFLWTLISTPDTDMQHRDGKDHWVCVTGGFTGPPGGIVFFFILVAYEGVIMLFGVFLTIVTRKVPSRYNEGKLIAISIYNVCFLAAVIIPIVFVLTNIDPFAAWIIRTLAILYAFTATLWLQFVPMMVGVICIDKLKEPPMKQVFRHSTGASSGTKSASAAASANSAASGSGTSAD